jgi:ribosomal protein S18 acetylase RimI-like enzyme
MEILIRQWTQDDLDPIRDVTWETWLAAYTAFIPESDLRSYFDSHYSLQDLQTLFSSESINGYVAVEGVNVVGYVRTQLNREENRFYVSSLYVLPAYQGKGIGSKLLKAAETCALKHDLDAVWLGVMVQNSSAVDWYKRIGFEFNREEPFTMGQTTVNHLIGSRHIQHQY